MTAPSTLHRRPLLLTFCLWALVAVLWAFNPGLTGLNLAWLLAICVVAVYAPRYTCLRDTRADAVMAAVCALLVLGVSLNAWYFTMGLGGTAESPVLVNDDSFRWWNDALYHLGMPGAEAAPPRSGGFGWLLACVLCMGGVNVGAALIWSMAMILCSLLMAGVLVRRVTSDPCCAMVGMIALAAVCYWLSMGTLILKDATVIAAVLVGALGVVSTERKRFLTLVILAALMLAIVRLPYVLILILGVLIVSTSVQRRMTVVTAVAVCAVIWLTFELWDERLVKATTLIAGTNEGAYTFTADQQMAWHNIIGDYTEMSPLRKLLLLPLCAVVQFFIPFPWTAMRDVPFGLTQIWAHMGFAWYLYGYLVLYFLIARIKEYRHTCYRLTLWGLICWLLPCYLVAGTVSRYGLPFVALFAPAVAMVIKQNWRNKRFYIITGIYILLVAAILLCAYILQSKTI